MGVSEGRGGIKQIIHSGWHGDASLRSAFWLYFFLGQFVVALVLTVFASPLLIFGENTVTTAKYLTYPLYYTFVLWAMVSIWRCSENAKRSIWKYAARSFVVLYALGSIIGYLQF